MHRRLLACLRWPPVWTCVSPLVLALQVRETGALFYFMNNRLYRSREAERHKQAQLLNDWAETVSLPVIAAGDYNFDGDNDQGAADHDRGYDLMTAGGAWQWVRPVRIVPTQCGDAWPCSYDDVLDFVFVAGPARAWRAESKIIVTPGDFPDDTSKSDHRPGDGGHLARAGRSRPDRVAFADAGCTAPAGSIANTNANLHSASRRSTIAR